MSLPGIPDEIPIQNSGETTNRIFLETPEFQSDMLTDRDVRLAVLGLFMGRIQYIPSKVELVQILDRVDEAVSYVIGDDDDTES
jgi:hypothetical protein